jgi:hypothetical protein
MRSRGWLSLKKPKGRRFYSIIFKKIFSSMKKVIFTFYAAAKKTLALSLLCLCLGCAALLPAQTTWTSRTSAADNTWLSVTYGTVAGNGLFVAVAISGTGNRVMTSPDGINWTSRTSAANNSWRSVTYGTVAGNGLFVAVASSGTGNRVMTSPDGINWTSRTSAANFGWNSVTYGNNLFVAVSSDGTGNRVMTSPNGINWTLRTSAADNTWTSVTYGTVAGNGLFVAVSSDGTGNRVMTSPDGITWTSRTSAADNVWQSVTYGNNLFVAVAQTGTSNLVMTSPDGITWTSRTPAAGNQWRSVTYGNGVFVAVSSDGTGNRVMTSPDGINWTSRTSAADNQWYSVTYANGLFVTVAISGTGNRVMTSPDASLPVELVSFSGKYIPPSGGLRGATEGGNWLTWETANEVNNKGFEIEASPDPSKGGEWRTIGFVAAKGKDSNYEFTDKAPLWGVGGLYYRLRQIDNDGKETLSKVISIESKGTKGKLSVYPNPVSTHLTIEVIARNEATEGGDFQIFNLLGQQVLTGKTPFGGRGLDVSALPQGTYILKMGAEQAKFIKK